jgi:maltooligosyltrehalose synthase
MQSTRGKITFQYFGRGTKQPKYLIGFEQTQGCVTLSWKLHGQSQEFRFFLIVNKLVGRRPEKGLVFEVRKGSNVVDHSSFRVGLVQEIAVP